MVAFGKIFAAALAVCGVVAAPVANEAPATNAVETRTNPTSARIIRGLDNKSVAVLMSFANVPAALANNLAASGFEKMKGQIINNFMQWLYQGGGTGAQKTLFGNAIAGAQGISATTACVSNNGLFQFQMLIELASPNNLVINDEILKPLYNWLLAKGVTDVLSSTAKREVSSVSEEPASVLARSSDAATCATVDNTNLLQYTRAAPPTSVSANKSGWCSVPH